MTKQSRDKKRARIQDKIMTTSEAAERMGTSRQWLNSMVKGGGIVPIAKGVYLRDDIEAFMNKTSMDDFYLRRRRALQEERSRQQMSQKDLARAAGISEMHYRKIEVGIADPSDDVAYSIAASIGADAATLFNS